MPGATLLARVHAEGEVSRWSTPMKAQEWSLRSRESRRPTPSTPVADLDQDRQAAVAELLDAVVAELGGESRVGQRPWPDASPPPWIPVVMRRSRRAPDGQVGGLPGAGRSRTSSPVGNWW